MPGSGKDPSSKKIIYYNFDRFPQYQISDVDISMANGRHAPDTVTIQTLGITRAVRKIETEATKAWWLCVR